MAIFKILAKDLAIDLGSANTLVYKKNKGIVLDEASQVAIDIASGEIVAVGNRAEDMIGKAPENIGIVNPLQDGTVSDFDFTKILIKYCLDSVNGGLSLIQPKIVVTAPTGVSDIELRAIEDACIHSGAREVYILESAIASAIGAGFDVAKSEGVLLVNLGAGNTDVAIISLNGIVISKNIKLGGDDLDFAIQQFIEEKYATTIGINTAKELKHNLANFSNNSENKSMTVSGRSLTNAMPVTFEVFQSDVKEAMSEIIFKIIDTIKYVIEKNPPELSKDILKNGIFLTGGVSQIEGLDRLIEEQIGIPAYKSENPLTDTINGAGYVLNHLEKYKNIGK